jgi:hypothetical protein
MACERPWMARRSGPGWPGGCCARSSCACCLRLRPGRQERLASPGAPGVRELKAPGPRVVRVEHELVHPVIHARPAIAGTIASGPPTAMRRRWRSRRRAASPPLPRGTSSDDPPTGALSPSEHRVDATRSGRPPWASCLGSRAGRVEPAQHHAKTATELVIERDARAWTTARCATPTRTPGPAARCYALARELFAMRGLRVRAETQA